MVHHLSALQCMNARKRITTQSCNCNGLIFSWADCLFKVFIDAFNSFVHVYRSHIHLHLGDCPQRVVKCIVKGCHNFYALEEEADHNKQYQESHQVLLKQEVEAKRNNIWSGGWRSSDCKKEMNSLLEISTKQAATDVYLDIV